MRERVCWLIPSNGTFVQCTLWPNALVLSDEGSPIRPRSSSSKSFSFSLPFHSQKQKRLAQVCFIIMSTRAKRFCFRPFLDLFDHLPSWTVYVLCCSLWVPPLPSYRYFTPAKWATASFRRGFIFYPLQLALISATRTWCIAGLQMDYLHCFYTTGVV